MGSYDNIVKIEEMRKRMEEGNTQAAQSILDTMELKKIKNMSDLSLIAEVYSENERYEEAIKLYLRIYEKTKTRKALFQLVDLSIKNNKTEAAAYYLEEYQKLAPKDFYKYIFRYKIDKMKSEPYEVLIRTLDTLKHTEYMEKWAYELAKIYYKAGMEKECIQECSDIILWFGEGTYVEKAKLLRSYFSGEVDKEKMIEELKRRSMEDTARTDTAAVREREQEEAEAAEAVKAEDGVYDMTDVSTFEQTADFEDGLKKDIQNIMEEEFSEEEDQEQAEISEEPHEAASEEPHETASEEAREAASEEAQEVAYVELLEESLEEESQPDHIRSERDIAEQEVEKALYQLLEEEEMDEDDRRMNEIAEQYSFIPEELFGNFLHVKSVKKQLIKSLEGILDEHTKMVQIIITGTSGSGKTTLAKDITMFLFKIGKLKSSKIAKITAEKLNEIDILSKKDTLKDCCLVVENASELKRQTIDNLLALCDSLKGNMAVIFEENKKNMNKLFRECPKLMDLFKNRIHLPQYTQEDLMGFAFACLKQKDYRWSPKVEAILQHRITQISKQSEPHMQLEQIYQLMQAAMDSADIRTGKQLSELASSGKLTDVDVLTVLPEDFTIKP